MTARAVSSTFRLRSAVRRMYSDSGVVMRMWGAFFEHEPALARGRIAGTHRHADFGKLHAISLRERADFAQGFLQVLLDVVAERLERRDVDEAAGVFEFARERVPNQPVERPQEGGQRLARARGGGDERVAPGGDLGPARVLRERSAPRISHGTSA